MTVPQPDPAEASWRTRQVAIAGRYELVSELGRGAMGVVWRARELGSGREVALKLIRSAQEAVRARVQREGELAARLDHPGIVRVHALGEAEGVIWLACELVEGARTLDAVLPGLAPAERVGLVRDVARALGHAHARGVVHRDVKPQNLLVGADGRVRVTDFGVATALGMDRLTRTGALVGTPHYMAPELVAPAPGTPVGPAADVWALGVVLYQALTGRLPFEAESFVGLAATICQAAPPPPRAHQPTTPPAAEAACLHALARLPGERYPDGEAMAADLDRLLRGERPLASTASASGATRPAADPRALARGGALLAAFLLLGGLVGLALLPGDPAAGGLSRLREALGADAPGHPRARLEAALEACLRQPPLDPSLEREARLRIARHAAEERPPAWEVVLVHAARAADLDPEAAEPLTLQATALTALGRAGEAVAPWSQLARVRGAPGDWEGLAAARLASGDGPGAHQACLRARQGGAVEPSLGVRCALAAGALADAEAQVAALGSDAAALPLRVELLRALGRDPEPLLRQALAAAPEQAAPVLALLRELLARGEVEEAVAALRAAGGEGTPDARLRAWLRTGEALLDVPEEPAALLEVVEPDLRGAVGAWLLREALRDLPGLESRPADPAGVNRHTVRRRLEAAVALLEGVDPPRQARACVGLALLLQPQHPDRVALLARAERLFPAEPELRGLRAREALQGRLAEAALAELDRAEGPPAAPWLDRHAHLLLRARAHLLRAELRAAERCLEEARPWSHGPSEGSEACRLLAGVRRGQGREEEARELLERAALLEGKRQGEGRRYWSEGSEPMSLQRVERALQLEPAWPEAHAAKFRLLGPAGLDEAGLQELFGAARADPRQQTIVTRVVRDPLRKGPVPQLDRLFEAPLADAPLAPFRRAWLLQLAIEHHSLPADDPRLAEALRLSDAWLDARPWEGLAWVVHGALALRRGFLARAERDLALAEQLAPGSAMIPFYRALLVGRRDGDVERCADLLREAYRAGYPRQGADLCDEYPELAAFAQDGLARVRIETAR